MKYEKLSFKKIAENKCNIKRYNDEVVVSKQCKIQFSPNQIKEIKFNGNIYKRDGQEIEIPWLSEDLLTYYEFYDNKNRERITLISFNNENGDIEYGFTDHND